MCVIVSPGRILCRTSFDVPSSCGRGVSLSQRIYEVVWYGIRSLWPLSNFDFRRLFALSSVVLLRLYFLQIRVNVSFFRTICVLYPVDMVAWTLDKLLSMSSFLPDGTFNGYKELLGGVISFRSSLFRFLSSSKSCPWRFRKLVGFFCFQLWTGMPRMETSNAGIPCLFVFLSVCIFLKKATGSDCSQICVCFLTFCRRLCTDTHFLRDPRKSKRVETRN